MNDKIKSIVYENHAQDSRVVETDDVCPCIGLTAGNCPSTSGNNPIIIVPLEGR